MALRKRASKLVTLMSFIIIMLVMMAFYTYYSPSEQIVELFRALLLVGVIVGIVWLITDP